VSVTTPQASWTTRNKVGLGLAIVYAITNIPSVLFSSDGENGPPMGIMVVCSVLGVVAAVAGVVAWRQRSRPAARLAAASIVVITLTSLPALFVDVPAGVKTLVAAGVVLTVVIVVLMFSAGRDGSPQHGRGAVT